MSDYHLALSDAEILRYRMMAQRAIDEEHDLFARAGVVPGAVVVDVGCGPAAMSVELARLVGPGGRVIGIERDRSALAAAQQVIAQSECANVEVHSGEATATGVGSGTADVVLMRHVLAHNGGREQQIVDHLADLARPGGTVYLLDVDLTAMRMTGADPDLDDVMARYAQFHRQAGNDPMVGLQLARLLAAAGLDPMEFVGRYSILEAPPGMRPPAWAARERMLSAGVIDKDTLQRWAAGFERFDRAAPRPTLFVSQFIGVGRRSA